MRTGFNTFFYVKIDLLEKESKEKNHKINIQ